MNPNCPASVRLGIGHCLAKLGNTAKAKLAFERVLELDPDNRVALTALTVIETGDADGLSDPVQRLKYSSQAFSAACSSDGEVDPYLLVLCARQCAYGGALKMAMVFVEAAMARAGGLPEPARDVLLSLALIWFCRGPWAG